VACTTSAAHVRRVVLEIGEGVVEVQGHNGDSRPGRRRLRQRVMGLDRDEFKRENASTWEGPVACSASRRRPSKAKCELDHGPDRDQLAVHHRGREPAPSTWYSP